MDKSRERKATFTVIAGTHNQLSRDRNNQYVVATSSTHHQRVIIISATFLHFSSLHLFHKDKSLVPMIRLSRERERVRAKINILWQPSAPIISESSSFRLEFFIFSLYLLSIMDESCEKKTTFTAVSSTHDQVIWRERERKRAKIILLEQPPVPIIGKSSSFQLGSSCSLSTSCLL